MSGLHRVMAWRPSLRPHYRASLHAIGLRVATVLFRHPTSQGRLHPSPSRLVRAYSSRRDRCSRRTRTSGISLVVSWTSCVARSWPSTPGLQTPLAKTRGSVLPSAGPNAWAGSESTCLSGLNTIDGLGGQPIPFVLANFLCTLQRNCYQSPLQHSILGLGLGVTQVGVAPTCP